MIRPLLALLLALLLAGCAQSPPTVPVEERGDPTAPLGREAAADAPGPAYPDEAPSLSQPEPRGPEPGAGPEGALLALLEQAEARHAGGQTQQALSLLERAQRIAPREPLVYLQLARLRLDLGDPVRAEQLARKGLSLSSERRMRRAFETILRELER